MRILLIFLPFIFCKGDKEFYPSEKDEDYNFPTYPFQQYIQVRKSYSVEHLPSYMGAESSGKDSLEKSASNHQQATSKNESPHYYKPPLREEIFVKKKQEVYEERGYSDGSYDHHGETEGDAHHHPYSSSSSNHHAKIRPIGSEEGESTKVLEHIANNMYDKDAHTKGFYRARSHIYCPEVIDFDLSSKSQGMGQGQRPKGKRRLQGLGSKIECLKNKYFGRELLPSAVFMEPVESKKHTIKMGSLKQFVDEMKKNIRH